MNSSLPVTSPQVTPPPRLIQRTDAGNARVLVRLAADRIRYAPSLGWLIWDGQRWRPDDTSEIMRIAREVPVFWYTRAAEVNQSALAERDDEKRKTLAKTAEAFTNHGRKTEAVERLQALVKLAQSEAEVVVRPKQLDADPWALNVNNGTLDLRTGELRPHRREDLITKLAPIDYDATAACPLWDKFLARVQPDATVRAFLMRLAGYSATGVLHDHVLPIHHGMGRNGKGVFHNSLMHVLGDYARQVPTEMFLSRSGDAHPTERTVLLGCRLAVASETDEGRSLNVALIKALTGGDTIAARRMRQDFFEFKPTHKLSLATNHIPLIRETKNAIWARVKLIPWTVTIPEEEQDLELEKKLQAEAAGILAWVVRGCLEWQRIGLSAPEAVRAATADYRDREDELAPFFDEVCILSPLEHELSRSLYETYCRWAAKNGEKPIGRRAFAERLTERGCKPGKGTGGARIWEGIGLRSDGPKEVAQGGATFGITANTEPHEEVMPEMAPLAPPGVWCDVSALADYDPTAPVTPDMQHQSECGSPDDQE